MIPGTTPTHKFNLQISTDTISCVRITYAQRDKVVLTKETKDCTLAGNSIEVKLTQADTLLFDEAVCVQVQVRVLTKDGDALATEIMRIRCGEILDKAVLE